MKGDCPGGVALALKHFYKDDERLNAEHIVDLLAEWYAKGSRTAAFILTQ